MMDDIQLDDKKLTRGTMEETPEHTIVQRISKPKELILLFWMAERNKASFLYTDHDLFAAAARTREMNIKQQPWYVENNHKIHNEAISAVHEIGTKVYEIINDYGGYTKAKVKEVSVFSHCGVDGPITYHSTVYPPLNGIPGALQMDMVGWKKINFNWVDEGAMCVFYGSFSAAADNCFAQKLSLLDNFKNVNVVGQTSTVYASFFPDYRLSSTNRRLGIINSTEYVYLVGGDEREGWKALCFTWGSIAELDTEEIKAYPKARTMNFYLNGVLTEMNSQEVFNDHRYRKDA